MSTQAPLLPFTAPIAVPSSSGISRSNSISSAERLRSSPYGHYHGANSNLEHKSSMANLSSRSLPRSSTLNSIPSHASLRPNIMQRSNTLPVPSRPQTPGLAPPPLPSRPRTPTVPKKAPSRSPPPSVSGNGHSTPGSQHERPSLFRRNSSAHGTPQVHTATSASNPDVTKETKHTVKPSSRSHSREELLKRVASEVETIEQETDLAARRILENVRSEKRKRGNSIDDIATPSSLTIDPFFRSESLRSRKQMRRGSIDSALAVDGGSPRSAREWERWAEDKVKARRQLEEAWQKEEDAFTESLVLETEKREAERREREVKKERQRQAFIEQERQRALREEKERQRTMREQAERLRVAREAEEKAAEEARRRAYEAKERMDRLQEARRREQQLLQEALLAESLRQEELEREVRRIEEEAKRLEEELRTREKKRQPFDPHAQADPESRGRTRPSAEERSQPRTTPYGTYGSQRSRHPTPESIRRTVEALLEESDSDFNVERQRFAEAFKLNGSYSKAQSTRTRTNRFTYQSPASLFKDAWDSYETKWAHLSSAAGSTQLAGGNSTASTPPPARRTRLRFSDIPWPILQQPSRASDVNAHLTEANISCFILSPFHSASPSGSSSPNTDAKVRKMRVREALLRWHPDKMARILAAIEDEEERRAVKDGAETVARHLNSLLAQC